MAKLVNSMEEAMEYCNKKGLQFVPDTNEFPQKVYKRGDIYGVGRQPDRMKPPKDGLELPLSESSWQILEIICDVAAEVNPEFKVLFDYLKGDIHVVPFEDFPMCYMGAEQLVMKAQTLHLQPEEWPLLRAAASGIFKSIVVMGKEVSLETFQPTVPFVLLKHDGKLYYIDGE